MDSSTKIPAYSGVYPCLLYRLAFSPFFASCFLLFDGKFICCLGTGFFNVLHVSLKVLTMVMGFLGLASFILFFQILFCTNVTSVIFSIIIMASLSDWLLRTPASTCGASSTKLRYFVNSLWHATHRPKITEILRWVFLFYYLSPCLVIWLYVYVWRGEWSTYYEL